MKLAKKIWLLCAAALVAIGLIVCVAVLALNRFDFSVFDGAVYEEKSYPVTETFSRVRINDVDCDLRLVKSSDGSCRVACTDSDRVYHTVTVEDGTLTVVRADDLAWYEWISFFGHRAAPVTVYLPEERYEALNVVTVSGKIEVPQDFSFSQLSLHSTSGDIQLAADAQTAELGAVSGELALHGMTGERLTAETVSGGVTLSDLSLDTLKLGVTSGEIRLEKVTVRGETVVNSTSGNLTLDRVRLAQAALTTVSGNVRGSVYSENEFLTHTTSGRVRVPGAGGAGICRIETVSGNIDLTRAE